MEKSMRSKIEELPPQTEAITDKITGMTEVLDDIAELLNEAMNAVGNSPIAQTPSSPVEAILSAFNGSGHFLRAESSSCGRQSVEIQRELLATEDSWMDTHGNDVIYKGALCQVGSISRLL